ncbi:hypothetical protein EDEG_03546 [Edhazardia aedis USNM 41457]|uniref:Uncharacterized protein n=1 Tax=Edhazardia aedis (strain USNM 41457) TaxID=1003232 RepID=J9D354_EDHAE|nr:hypothetical protein EDEG_03546 [Edhazardia aedis USNM 41457]|eukprot:EJW02004.1 hypothetical protein EDEG_03546 [Edhazardia aedis USNM 41457]
MFTIVLCILTIFATNLEIYKARLRQIVDDIQQYKARIWQNSNIIYGLDCQRCNIDNHYSIKRTVESEINKLENEKLYVQNLTTEKCLQEHGKANHQVLREIDSLIENVKSHWSDQEKKFNESISIKEGYERINKSLQEKIDSLNSEKKDIQSILDKHK